MVLAFCDNWSHWLPVSKGNQCMREFTKAKPLQRKWRYIIRLKFGSRNVASCFDLFLLDSECDAHCSGYVWILFPETLTMGGMIKNDRRTQGYSSIELLFHPGCPTGYAWCKCTLIWEKKQQSNTVVVVWCSGTALGFQNLHVLLWLMEPWILALNQKIWRDDVWPTDCHFKLKQTWVLSQYNDLTRHQPMEMDHDDLPFHGWLKREWDSMAKFMSSPYYFT